VKGSPLRRKDRCPSESRSNGCDSPGSFFFVFSFRFHCVPHHSLIHGEAFSASAIFDKIAFSFLVSPGVSCISPSDVTKRYAGIGWYVSGRIYGSNQSQVVPHKFDSQSTSLFSTRTVPMISSGSPIRLRAGMFRWSIHV